MQALDWLFEKVCFEAIGHVVLVHDLESDQANISAHHLSMLLLQRCIDHTMTLEAVSNILHALYLGGSMSFGRAFLDRSSGLHGSDERGGCTMPGGVGGVDPGLPAPPPVCWGGVPPGVELLVLSWTPSSWWRWRWRWSCSS